MANNPTTLYITCYCGLARLLDPTVKGENGEKVTLAPCPKCGAGFHGTYSNGRIIIDDE